MLDDLIRQIDSLPPDARRVLGSPRSGTEVFDALSHPELVQNAIKTRLKEAILWQLTSDGRLIVGDGCADPAPETLFKLYDWARYEATAVGVGPKKDGASKVVRLPYVEARLDVGADKISWAKGWKRENIDLSEQPLLWVSRLATAEEYTIVNHGQFDRNSGSLDESGFRVQLFSGANPQHVPLACYDASQEKVVVDWNSSPLALQPKIGARRVVEVYLYGLE